MTFLRHHKHLLARPLHAIGGRFERHHKLVALCAGALIALLCYLAHLSPWALVSVSSLTSAIVIVLQGWISNVVAGVSMALRGGIPAKTVVMIEGIAGVAVRPRLLALECVDSQDGGQLSIPWIKFQNDIVKLIVPKE